ncbi:uncharacterized protein BDW43DRAFT_311846 [Aspergillus alliaceus]|uniref:uncharacterized protein n=1 Tax=Petromyces alliaceus TaxID=209559 RepID=UPI0012A55820|nr:uncharacterized protein BDW43DRAFT_311846 [Aspergillus alliaceus]KAB8232774.1 hypothetical protein BDW43DRAFT_311846 [Aspergillus alliaceus]
MERPWDITVWTEFQVAEPDELEAGKWMPTLEPLVQAPGHKDQLWETTSALREFNASPGFGLYWEGIASLS